MINDWVDNDQIDGTYPLHCYQDAIAHVPEDLRAYSDIVKDIMNARQARLRAQNTNLRTLQSHDSSSSPSGAAGPKSNDPNDPGSGSAEAKPPDPSLFEAGFNKVGPANGDSIPLPLLILAGLALLLIAAGAAGLVSRRLRARKIPG